jgi:hypothetical protein
MAALVLDDLDDYSRFAVPLILARFPGWERFGVVRPRPDGAGGTVEFHVPCPLPGVEAGLYVSTADAELTVGFHTHHTHFTDYDVPASPDQVAAGLGYAAAFLEDRVGVVSWYTGARLVGTTSCELPVSGPVPRMFARLAVTRGTVRSWSGRFDRDEPAG